MTANTVVRRTNSGPPRGAASTRKSTAYGRAVWRALKEMQKAGPWEFGPRVSERIFNKS